MSADTRPGKDIGPFARSARTHEREDSAAPGTGEEEQGVRPLRFLDWPKGDKAAPRFRPLLYDIFKDYPAALLAAQLEFWFEVAAKDGQQEIYKRIEPAGDPRQNVGGTWWGELRFNPKRYARAWSKIGIGRNSQILFGKAVREGQEFFGPDGRERPYCSYIERQGRASSNYHVYRRNQRWFDRNISSEYLAPPFEVPAPHAIKARIVQCYDVLHAHGLVPRHNFRKIDRDDAIEYFMAAVDGILLPKGSMRDPGAVAAVESAQLLYEELEDLWQEESPDVQEIDDLQ